MKLFCFACRNSKNIPIGISAGMWAVSTLAGPQMRARATKARKNLRVGDLGLLYCSPIQAFTTPFIVASEADEDRVVTGVWPEPWVLPFQIDPLSDGTRSVSKDIAKAKWSLLDRIPWKRSISGTLNFTGTTIFVPTEISQSEWDEIVADFS